MTTPPAAAAPREPGVRIIEGDALSVLRTLEPGSVQLVCTSPPYFQLRRYLDPSDPNSAHEIGSEQTPAAFIAALIEVFREVRRVLRPDGLVFCNLGDSYSGSGKGGYSSTGIVGDHTRRQGFDGDTRYRSSTLADGRVAKNDGYKLGERVKPDVQKCPPGIAPKNLLLIPERFAIAMQDDGWYVRSRIAWCKTSAMPESVRDRPTSAWEHVWMFSKQARYFYDAEAVRTPAQPMTSGRNPHGARGAHYKIGNDGTTNGVGSHPTAFDGHLGFNPAGANLRNFWLLGPEPSKLEHYASYPTELVRRCILAGTSERGACPACGAPWRRLTEKGTSTRQGPTASGWREASKRGEPAAVDRIGERLYKTLGWQQSCQCPPSDPVPCVVLDPFSGSGTTALVANRLGRAAIGIELNGEYVEMSRKRIENDAGSLFGDAVTVEPAPTQLALEDVAG